MATVDQVLAEEGGPLAHRPGVAVERGLRAEEVGHGVGPQGGDLAGVETAVQPLLQAGRAPEGPRHRHLLVQQHADQQRQR